MIKWTVVKTYAVCRSIFMRMYPSDLILRNRELTLILCMTYILI